MNAPFCSLIILPQEHHAGSQGLKSAADLRKLLHDSCTSPGTFVAANFDRGSVGMTGGGHFSPVIIFQITTLQETNVWLLSFTNAHLPQPNGPQVVAYSPQSDLALVLDVARYK